MKDEEIWAWKSVVYKITIVAGIWIFYDIFGYVSKENHRKFVETQKDIIREGIGKDRMEVMGGGRGISL